MKHEHKVFFVSNLLCGISHTFIMLANRSDPHVTVTKSFQEGERERVLTLWQSPSENSKSNVDNSCWTSFHGQLQKGEMPLNMKPINGKRSYRLHLTKPRQEQAKHDNTKLHQNQVIKQVVITKINFSSNWFFFIISYSQVPCKIMFQPSLISQNLGCEWPNAWKHTQNPCQIG